MKPHMEYYNEDQNRTIGFIVALVLHALLLLVSFVTVFTHLDPPPVPDNSVFVVFDEIIAQETEDAESSAQEGAAATAEPNQNPKAFPPQPTNNPPKIPDNVKSKVTTDVADVIAQPKESEADRKKRLAAEEKVRQERLAAEAQAKKEAELEASKKKFGDLLGKSQASSGTGQQGTGSNDDGQSVLDNLSKGTGTVGIGLGNRKVIFTPSINETSQKSGKVIVEICIDASGRVIKAKYTQRGSTTTDTGLVKAAERGALKYKFSVANIDEQCGEIAINFVVE